MSVLFLNNMVTRQCNDIKTATKEQTIRFDLPSLTDQHVAFGLAEIGGRQSVDGLKVLDDEDIRYKCYHVLFPTTVRHLDQVGQAADSWSHNVTFI